MIRPFLFTLALTGGSMAHAEVPVVVTDIPVVQSLVAQVMGDLGTPELLVNAGAEPHSYQMRPSQVRALRSADLIFWVGPEMTPWLDRALQTAPEGSSTLLLSAPGTMVQPYPEYAGVGSADQDHDDHDHDHDSTDPHAWLDPVNGRAWLAEIRDRLAATDPDNAATYSQNAETADSAISALEDELQTTLAAAAGKPLVMGHNAYGYFASRFGLTIAATIEAGDAAEPGAAHLSAVTALLSAQKAICLFPETGQDPKRAALLVEGTNTRLGGALDPEGISLPTGPALYGELMRKLAQTVADCVAQG